MYDPDKTDFCYYPFFQVLMSAEGRFKPCSKHEDFITHNGEILEVGKATIEDAWNSDYMQTMRENFKNNVRTKGCVQCWKEQALGLKPMRYDSYNYRVPDSQVESPLSPMRVEINASNVCNLRCRICWSHASTKWIKEAKDLYGVDGETHINLTADNFDIIKKWVPNFTEIGYFGGEPLLNDMNIELMRYCVESGHSSHITILINTNTTVYTDEIAGLFKKFKKVFLNFSIDDIGPRFEYQRGYAKWEVVVDNMRKYIAHGGFTANDTIECKICCSVTAMNVFYFPEYFEFMNEHFPGLPVFWNLVYAPWSLSMQTLPHEIKQLIAERLKNFVRTSYRMEETRTKTIENLITFLNADEQHDFAEFFRTIVRHDKYRQESFPEVFPEFWSVIEKYKPADVVMHYERMAI
ncbi:MAG TPA: twitch domain-containing radical SAM protein [Chitinophagales bacterium]|nr:twitch domain-containing radical SAM protein [Chitinophagales bacterium]